MVMPRLAFESYGGKEEREVPNPLYADAARLFCKSEWGKDLIASLGPVENGLYRRRVRGVCVGGKESPGSKDADGAAIAPYMVDETLSANLS